MSLEIETRKLEVEPTAASPVLPVAGPQTLAARDLTTYFAVATFFLIITAQSFWSTIHGDGAIYARLMRQISEMGIFSSQLPYWSQTDAFAEHPYLYFYFSSVFTKIFGYSDLALKLPNFVVAALSVGLVYFISRLKNEKNEMAHQVGLIAGYLLLLNATYIMQVAQPSLDPFAQLLSLLAVAVFIFYRRNFFAGLLLGLAFLTKGLELLPHLAALGVLTLLLHRQSLKEILKVSLQLAAGLLIPLVAWLALDYFAWNSYWMTAYWDRQFTNRFFTKSNMQAVFDFGYLETFARVYFFELVIIAVGLFKSKQWLRKKDALFLYFVLYVFFNTVAFLLIKKNSSQHITGTLLFGALFVAEYLWELSRNLNWGAFRKLPQLLFAVALVYWGVFVFSADRNPDIYTAIKNEAPTFAGNTLPIVIDNNFSDVYGFYHTAQWYFHPSRVFSRYEADEQLAGQQVYLVSDSPLGKFVVEKRVYQK